MFQFENRYYLTNQILQEYCNSIACADIRKVSLVLFILHLSMLFITYSVGAVNYALFFATFVFLSAVIFLAAVVRPLCFRKPKHSPCQFDRGETIVRFGDRIYLTEDGTQMWADYEQITKIQHLRSFSILKLGKQDAVILSASGFTKGNGSEFWHFLSRKRPDLKIKIRPDQLKNY